MSTSAVAGPPEGELAESVSRLVDAARGYVVARLAGRLDDAIAAVKDGVSEPDGMLPGAAVGVVKTAGSQRSPLWAAAKGAWAGADSKARVAVVAGLVLALLLGPVVLVVGLLVLLVKVVVEALRRAVASGR